jgi:hypothetical protein
MAIFVKSFLEEWSYGTNSPSAHSQRVVTPTKNAGAQPTAPLHLFKPPCFR